MQMQWPYMSLIHFQMFQKAATWKIKKKMAIMKVCSELCFITGFEYLGSEAELVGALSTKHD